MRKFGIGNVQKFFVLLTLLCASLSGSGVVAEAKLDFVEGLQTAYDELKQKKSQSFSDSSDYTTADTSQTFQKNQNSPVFLAKFGLGLVESDKQTLDLDDDADPYLAFEYLIQSDRQSCSVESEYTARITTSHFSTNAIRAPPSFSLS